MIQHSRAPDHESSLKCGWTTNLVGLFAEDLVGGTPNSWTERWINVHQVVGYFVEEHHITAWFYCYYTD